MQVTLRPNAPRLAHLCAANALGTAECEYVFYGKWNIQVLDYDCCAHGFTDPDVSADLVPEEYCDSNSAHSPYRCVCVWWHSVGRSAHVVGTLSCDGVLAGRIETSTYKHHTHMPCNPPAV